MGEMGGRTERVDLAMEQLRGLKSDGRLKYQKHFGFRLAQAMHQLRCLRDMAEQADNLVERGVRVDD